MTNKFHNDKRLDVIIARRVVKHIKYPEEFKIEMIERRLKQEKVKRGGTKRQTKTMVGVLS